MFSDWRYSSNSLEVNPASLSDMIFLGLNVYDCLRSYSIAVEGTIFAALVDLVAYSNKNVRVTLLVDCKEPI